MVMADLAESQLPRCKIFSGLNCPGTVDARIDFPLRKSVVVVPCPARRMKRAHGAGPPAEKGGGKEFLAWGSAEPIEKARFGQGNPRKSKPFSLLDLAKFGIDLENGLYTQSISVIAPLRLSRP